MKLRHIFLLIILFIVHDKINAQSFNHIPIKTLEGRPLLIVDSLSFKEENLASEFYVDSMINRPYSGKAIVYYADKALDSLNLIDGIKNGWQKLYLKTNTGYQLAKVEYYDQFHYVYISQMRNEDEKHKHSSSARYYTDTEYYFFEVIYKSLNKIVIKQSVTTSTGRTNKKIKIKSLEQLEQFFKKHSPIYLYCKQAGFFGKPEIE